MNISKGRVEEALYTQGRYPEQAKFKNYKKLRNLWQSNRFLNLLNFHTSLFKPMRSFYHKHFQDFISCSF